MPDEQKKPQQDMRDVSGKLTLLSPSEQLPTVSNGADRQGQIAGNVLLDQLKRGVAPATVGLARFGLRVRRDPAYAFLIVALVVVLVASVYFTSFAWSTVSRFVANGAGLIRADGSGSPTQTSTTGAVDFKPAFPAPGGGKGANQSSQPPFSAPVTFPPDTPTATDSPTPGSGDGTVQIVSIPSNVANNTTVSVVVQADQPGVTVYLSVTYDTQPPSSTTTAPRLTDANGQVTLSWRIKLFFRQFGATITAHVTAIAIDANGGQSMSQSVTVTVTLR